MCSSTSLCRWCSSISSRSAGSSGSTCRPARFDQKRSPVRGSAREQQLEEFVTDPFGRDDLDPLGHGGHRRDYRRRDLEPELAANRAARIIRSGSSLTGPPGGPASQHPAARSRSPPYGSTKVPPAAARPSRSTVKSRRRRSPVEGVAGRHLGLARLAAVAVVAVRRDLDTMLALARADRAEAMPTSQPASAQAGTSSRTIGRASVVKSRSCQPAQQRVAHRPPTRASECPAAAAKGVGPRAWG